MLGVAIGTAILIFVLSVFNGLEGIIQDLHSTFTPDIKITTIQGKTFVYDTRLQNKIKGIQGIAIVGEVIEDNALVSYRDRQIVVNLRGVSDNYTQVTQLDSTIYMGRFALQEGEYPAAIIGYGVRHKLSIGGFRKGELEEQKMLLKERFIRDYSLEFWYPKKGKRLAFSSLDPRANLNKKNAIPTGVFTIEKKYDDRYVFVPISLTKELMGYTHERTSLELKISPQVDIEKVKQDLKATLGKNFRVQDKKEQQGGLIKALKVEKLFVYITFSFILGVASLNIFFSLMMLAIDKKKDVAILKAMGASNNFIRRIFIYEGSIIAFVGAIIGMFLGLGMVLLQQKIGFIQMAETSIVSYYPVEIELLDFVSVVIPIVLITLLASYFPANKAAKIDIKEQI